MKIPTFEEIQLNQACDQDYIEEKFIELGIGEIPLVIRADKISRDDFIETLPRIENVLKKLKINPHLPYPIVILTPHIKEHHYFDIVAEDEDLLPHFANKTKRPSKKELQILSKISIAKDKLLNSIEENYFDEIQKITRDQRTLYEISKELHFYEQIKKKYIRPSEKRNELKKR